MRIFKKFIACAAAAAMLISLVSSFEFSAFAAGLEGSGTSDDPFIISDLSSLEAFSEYVNGGLTSYGMPKHFKLTADINMSDKYGPKKDSWEPIGAFFEGDRQALPGENVGFQGIFDGGGHTISGLYIDSKYSYIGLFGVINSSATVKNLSVNGTVTGDDYTGGIAGYICDGSTIINCSNNCAVTGGNDTGGIVGHIEDSSVSNCFNTGAIFNNRAITGNGYAGGIAGNNNGAIENCYNIGEVNSNSEYKKDLLCGIACCEPDGPIPTPKGFIHNCYYLEKTREDPNATVKTEEEFISGEVAYLLQSGCLSSPTWGQNGDFPDLIALNDGMKILRKVTFVSERPNIGTLYLPDGDKLSVQNDYPYIKWSQTAPGGEHQAEFDLSTPITRDLTLYLMEGREFEQSSDADIALKAECGFPFEQDLSKLLMLNDGSSAKPDDFEFKPNEEKTLPSCFTIEDGKLKSDCVALDIGKHSITINVVDKNPYSNIALTALDPEPAEFYAVLTINIEVGFRGGGTKNSPYEIPNLAALEAFRNYINSGNSKSEYFKLTDNIELGGKNSPWTPIGDLADPFGGTFDGGGHLISGLYINSDDGYLGLFGNSSGTLQNLGVSGEIVGSGNSYAGGVVGFCSYGTIENCYNLCSLSGCGIAGGITGDNYSGEITNCYNSGTISGESNVGGIAGFNRGTIEKCYNVGEIEGKINVGGICAGKSGNVTDCYYLENTHADLNAEVKTADEFKSGEVAWLLQSGSGKRVWGQKIGEDNYPILTSDADKKIVKVTFSTNDNANYEVQYANAGGKLLQPLPDDPETGEDVEFEMWSASSAPPFEEFTADTLVTEDTVVHSVGRELFGGKSEEISLSGTYGEDTTADLSQYIEYKNSGSVSGRFSYTISDKGQTEATINGDMITIPKNTNAGSYTLTVTAEEMEPLYSLASVETFGAAPVTLKINVNIAKADPVVVVKSANALYDDDPEPDELVIGTTSGGTLQYSTDGKNYTEDIPKAHQAGEYTVWYKVVGDNNYNDTAPKSIKVKIAHGFADVAAEPRAVSNLVFSGEPQELITAGSGTNGEMQYSLDGENYSPDIPKGTAAGEYTVWYKVVGGFVDGKHYHDSEAASLTATIGKGDSTVESDGADVVYGDAFTLTAEVSKTDAGASLASDEDKVDFYIGGTFLGSAEADYGGAELKDSGTASLTVTADKKFAIGPNTIRAMYGGSVNLNSSENSSITITMTQKPIEYEVSARNKTYDGTADVEVTLTPTNSGDDNVALTAKGAAPSANAGSYETVDLTEITISGTDAGYYSVESEKSGVELETLNIAKADPNVVVKSAKALYDDSVQELVTYEAPSGVTVLFSDSEDGVYSVTIPTGKDAGEYTVWYKAVGNNNYNDLPPASIDVKIAHGFADVTKAPTAVDGLVYSGSPQRLITPGEAENGEMRYSLDGGDYSAEIPTAVKAGTYTVWYMAEGGFADGKHYHDSDPSSLMVTIAKQGEFDYIINGAALGDDGKLDIDLEYQLKEPKAAVLIVASYDAEGALTGTKEFDINGASADLGEPAPRGNKIKIFIWRSLDDMTPLAAPYEIK